MSIPEICQELDKFPPIELEVESYLENGIYCRKMSAPAGTAVVGAKHLSSYMEIMPKGKIQINLGNDEVKEIEAPFFRVAQPGINKMAVVLEDMEWYTFHATNARTIEEAEEECLDPKDLEILRAKEDYFLFKKEVGLTEELIQKFVSLPNVAEDLEIEGVTLGKSRIHGVGIFSTKDFSKGDILGVSLFGGVRSILGRYTNHSIKSNACSQFSGNDIYLVCTRDIYKGEEILINYRGTLCQE